MPLSGREGKPLVFISCGQFTEEEKELGRAIAALVEQHTPYEGYFAQNQQSLETLSRHIFGALNRAVGLIAVMHPRGQVSRRSVDQDPITRGSVWVEQEIAIAAFLQQTLAKPIEVLSYIHQGVAREGVREQLTLNSVVFTENHTILDDLRRVLPGWRPAREPDFPVSLNLSRENVNITGERHDYRLRVTAENRGLNRIEKFTLDVLLPKDIIDNLDSLSLMRVKERDSPTHYAFRATEDGRGPLPPEQPRTLLTLPYFVDTAIYRRREVVYKLPIRATLYAEGGKTTIEKSVEELSNF